MEGETGVGVCDCEDLCVCVWVCRDWVVRVEGEMGVFCVCSETVCMFSEERTGEWGYVCRDGVVVQRWGCGMEGMMGVWRERQGRCGGRLCVCVCVYVCRERWICVCLCGETRVCVWRESLEIWRENRGSCRRRDRKI